MIRSGLAGLVGMALALAPHGALAQAGPPSVAALAGGVVDAVVNISTTRTVPGGMTFPRAPQGSPLSDLFEQRNPNSGQGSDALAQAMSLGSGFLIDPDGLIVTNYHVIDDAEAVVIILSDGTRLEAEIVGADAVTDLAVLRVHAAAPLPYVAFGDSETTLVGDWVMVVGNPFGLGGSVSLGIVSARNRDINVGPYDSFIQTDAAINQGSSGGPMFDMNGDVVGINTAILSGTGDSLGIGFAIPGNLAWPVIEQLITHGEVQRGWLGVGVIEVTDTHAVELGLPHRAGAYVSDIDPDGPAAGLLLAGDVITAFNSRPIAHLRDLPRAVAAAGPGARATLTVRRDGGERAVELVLGQLAAFNALADPS